MILCSCFGVNDQVVEAALDDGASDLESIAERCRAGTDCGGCVGRLAMLLDQHHAMAGAEAS